MRLTCAVVSCLLAAALPSFGCASSHDVEPDGSVDAGKADASGLMPCERAGNLEPVGTPVAPPDPESAGVALLRARATAGGGVAVLTRHQWEGVGGVRRLLVFGPDGDLVDDREVKRDESSWVATADFARVGDEWWVVGRDMAPDRPRAEDELVWLARVTTDSVDLRDLEVFPETDGQVRGPTVMPVTGSEALDVYLVQGGRLLNWRLTAAGIERTEMELRVEDNVRPFVVDAAGAGGCLTLRERSSGRLGLLRVESSRLTSDPLWVTESAPFNPIPAGTEMRCRMPYFAPDATHPTEGSIEMTGVEGAMTGWRGTAPVGLSADPVDPRSAFAATLHPELAGEVQLWWVRPPDSGACALREPSLTLSAEARAVFQPLGGLFAVRAAERDWLVQAGLHGAGEVELLRARRTAP